MEHPKSIFESVWKVQNQHHLDANVENAIAKYPKSRKSASPRRKRWKRNPQISEMSKISTTSTQTPKSKSKSHLKSQKSVPPRRKRWNRNQKVIWKVKNQYHLDANAEIAINKSSEKSKIRITSTQTLKTRSMCMWKVPNLHHLDANVEIAVKKSSEKCKIKITSTQRYNVNVITLSNERYNVKRYNVV